MDSTPIAFTYNGTHYYYGKNLFGDIVDIYDATGAKVVHYAYDAWGNHEVRDANGAKNTSADFIGNINPFRYRGYYYDTETGFYCINSRYYDPRTGRYINADTPDHLGATGELHGYNLYTYCGNNPISDMSRANDSKRNSAVLTGYRHMAYKTHPAIIEATGFLYESISLSTSIYNTLDAASTVWNNIRYFSGNSQSYFDDMLMLGASAKNGTLAFNDFSVRMGKLGAFMIGLSAFADVMDSINRGVSGEGVFVGAALTVAKDVALFYAGKGIIYITTAIGGAFGGVGAPIGFVVGLVIVLLIDLFVNPILSDEIDKIAK